MSNEPYKEYVISDTIQWPTPYYRLVRVNGETFPSRVSAVKYMRDKLGFEVDEAKEYIDSLPEARVGIEI